MSCSQGESPIAPDRQLLDTVPYSLIGQSTYILPILLIIPPLPIVTIGKSGYHEISYDYWGYIRKILRNCLRVLMQTLWSPPNSSFNTVSKAPFIET